MESPRGTLRCDPRPGRVATSSTDLSGIDLGLSGTLRRKFTSVRDIRVTPWSDVAFHDGREVGEERCAGTQVAIVGGVERIIDMKAVAATSTSGGTLVELAFLDHPVPTLVVNPDGELAKVNRAAVALLGTGVARAARTGATLASALPWLSDALEQVLDGADEVGLQAEVPVNGGVRSLSATLRPLHRGDSGMVGVVVGIEDLTARDELEARERLDERLASMGRLAAELAHEVNNPLACVLAGLSFAASENARLAPSLPPSELEETAAALEDARQSALRVRAIVRSLQRLASQPSPLLYEEEQPPGALGGALRRA